MKIFILFGGWSFKAPIVLLSCYLGYILFVPSLIKVIPFEQPVVIFTIMFFVSLQVLQHFSVKILRTKGLNKATIQYFVLFIISFLISCFVDFHASENASHFLKSDVEKYNLIDISKKLELRKKDSLEILDSFLEKEKDLERRYRTNYDIEAWNYQNNLSLHKEKALLLEEKANEFKSFTQSFNAEIKGYLLQNEATKTKKQAEEKKDIFILQWGSIAALIFSAILSFVLSGVEKELYNSLLESIANFLSFIKNTPEKENNEGNDQFTKIDVIEKQDRFIPAKSFKESELPKDLVKLYDIADTAKAKRKIKRYPQLIRIIIANKETILQSNKREVFKIIQEENIRVSQATFYNIVDDVSPFLNEENEIEIS